MLELNKIHCGDCLELMKEIPNNSIDLIATDPPYNINYKSNHGSDEYKKRIQTAQQWDNNFDFSLYFPELWRVLKNNSYMYVFGRRENVGVMEKLGYKNMLIWNKEHCGMGNLNSWGIGYELIFVFEKGRPKINGKRPQAVINLKHIGFFDKTIHPTQKPIPIMSFLIEKSSKPDQIVLDPFIGSGTTAIACCLLKRKFIGIDINPDYVETAIGRVKPYLEQRRLSE